MNPSRRLPTTRYSASLLLLLVSLCGARLFSSSATGAAAFSQFIVFGDSLSDTGNVRDRTNSKSGGTIDYPSHTFNYSNGRFTNDNATDPSSATFSGVWHEQLARTF